MKKTYKYAVVGLLFLFLAGCEDFLDKREDSGGLTEEAVYSSYESIRGFLDQVYPKLEAYNTFEGCLLYTSCHKRISVYERTGDYAILL